MKPNVLPISIGRPVGETYRRTATYATLVAAAPHLVEDVAAAATIPVTYLEDGKIVVRQEVSKESFRMFTVYLDGCGQRVADRLSRIRELTTWARNQRRGGPIRPMKWSRKGIRVKDHGYNLVES